MSFSSWIVVAAFLAMSPTLWWALADFVLDRVGLPERLFGRALQST